MPALPGSTPSTATPPQMAGEGTKPTGNPLPPSWQDPFNFMEQVTAYAKAGGPAAMKRIIDFINAETGKSV